MTIESYWSEIGRPEYDIWTHPVELDFASGGVTTIPLFLFDQLPIAWGSVNETLILLVDKIILTWTEAPNAAGSGTNFRVGTDANDIRTLGVNTLSGKSIGDSDIYEQSVMNNAKMFTSSGNYLQISSQGTLSTGRALCQISLTQDATRFYNFNPITGI